MSNLVSRRRLITAGAATVGSVLLGGCDEITPADQMDSALARLTGNLTGAGSVSATANRRAIRIGEEPLDLFRRYCSAYARDQAYCYFSPALIANLERNWDAKNRKI